MGPTDSRGCLIIESKIITNKSTAVANSHTVYTYSPLNLL